MGTLWGGVGGFWLSGCREEREERCGGYATGPVGCLDAAVKGRKGRSGHGSRDDGLWMDWRWMDDGYGMGVDRGEVVGVNR